MEANDFAFASLQGLRPPGRFGFGVRCPDRHGLLAGGVYSVRKFVNEEFQIVAVKRIDLGVKYIVCDGVCE